MSDIRCATPDPLYRPNVGLLLLNAEGLAFVGRRAKLAEEIWQLPQGGIDAGESPAQAALRELQEEVGTDKAEILLESDFWMSYALPDAIRARSWRGKWLGQCQRWFALRFTGTDADIDLDTHHPEFDAWKWIRREQLPGLIVAFKRPVYQAMLEEFEPKLKALGL